MRKSCNRQGVGRNENMYIVLKIIHHLFCKQKIHNFVKLKKNNKEKLKNKNKNKKVLFYKS